MTLSELKTPFKRRRVIEHSEHTDRVIRRWYKVQNITEVLYKTKDKEDEQGRHIFNLVIFLDDRSDGLLVFRSVNADEYTLEQIVKSYSRQAEYMCLDAMIAGYWRIMVSGQPPMGNAEIKFLHQFEPAFADTCAKYRLEHDKKVRESAERSLYKDRNQFAISTGL